jgi:hypothetical protein
VAIVIAAVAAVALRAGEHEVVPAVRSVGHDILESLPRAGGRVVDELSGLVGLGAHDTENQAINRLAHLSNKALLKQLKTATTSAEAGRILIAYGKHGDPEEAIVGATCDIGSKRVLGERQDWSDLLFNTALEQYGGSPFDVVLKAQNFGTYIELRKVRGGVVLAPVYQTACLDMD